MGNIAKQFTGRPPSWFRNIRQRGWRHKITTLTTLNYRTYAYFPYQALLTLLS